MSMSGGGGARQAGGGPVNPTLLDEWAAWCECAMLCEERLDDCGGFDLGKKWIPGICPLMAETMHLDVWEQATIRASRNRPRINRFYPFWWPHTRKGWDARAAFCWRMAEECELDGVADA